MSVSYLCLLNRYLPSSGSKLSFQRLVSSAVTDLRPRDHEVRNAWLGPAFPLDLTTLPLKSDNVPLQYPSLSKCGHLSVTETLF